MGRKWGENGEERKGGDGWGGSEGVDEEQERERGVWLGGGWEGREGVDGEEGRGLYISLYRDNTSEEGRQVYRATLVCCVCSYEKFSANKEPVIMNIEQKVTHA